MIFAPAFIIAVLIFVDRAQDIRLRIRRRREQSKQFSANEIRVEVRFDC